MDNYKKIQIIKSELNKIMKDYCHQQIIDKIEYIDWEIDELAKLIKMADDRTTTVIYGDGSQRTFKPNELIIF